MKEKTISITIFLMLLLTVFISMNVVADATHTELEILPNSTDIKKGNQITFSIYVRPQDGEQIDTVSVNNLTFSADKLQFSGSDVIWGNLFTDTTLQINGTVDNTNGWITDIVWGSNTPTSTNGYFCNLTFNTISTGTANINLEEIGVAYTAYGDESPTNMPYTIVSNGSVLIHEYIPNAPSGFSATRNDYQQINLSWSKGTNADKTYIEWSANSDPWEMGAGTELYNDTGTATTHTGLPEGTTRYYQAWSWNNTDNEWSATNTSDFATTNNIPNLGTPSPNNGSINQELSLTWQIAITDADSDTFDWTIECSNGQSNSANSDTDGTKQLSITGLDYSTTYNVFVNVTDGMDWERQWFDFTTRSQIAPTPPSSFTATAISTSQIDLTWTIGSNADNVYIERYSSQTWSRGTGTEIYNNTGESTSDTGLDPHTTYYYQAWGWNDTDGVYSDSYSESSDTTLNSVPTDPSTPDAPVNNSGYESVYSQYLNVSIADADGDSLDVYYYWANHTVIGTLTGLTGSTASLYLPDYIEPDWLNHNTEYGWYVNITDSYDTIHSPDWFFTTSKAWDANEDATINYIDISLLVSHYRQTCIPGEYGWEMNENGECDYLDVSLLVTYYGDTY